MDYSTNAFSPLSFQRLPAPYRLLYSSCCPDKDLLVLISRLGGRDRISLWKMHGSKCWEADVGTEDGGREEIVGLAWSPDGRSIAVAHEPPRVTLHSIQDGRAERHLALLSNLNSKEKTDTPLSRIVDIWWFREDKEESNKAIPDIFKRKGIITGSVHSILKTLPLLDHLQEDSDKTTVTDLFAFQGSQTKSTKATMPEFIELWPTLPPNLLLASISPFPTGKIPQDIDDIDESNDNSILVVADDAGQLSYFLDGSYPLGKINLPPPLAVSASSLYKRPKTPQFFTFPPIRTSSSTRGLDGAEKNDLCPFTDLLPVEISIPALANRKVRDVARLSSTARDLTWYAVRVVDEMARVWLGSDTATGAREVGAKWVESLEVTQRDHGQEIPSAILDLTTLLVTGRPSESLSDLLGSGEQMSERGIQKWESTVTDALVKLRDLAEKRLAPACQRLHLVLEEISALSQLPQYNIFFSMKDRRDQITHVAQMLGRAIIISAWLASAARRELFRFKEFIAWVRYETTAINSTNDTPANANTHQPRHDILEVNDYLTGGLIESPIDRFFEGPLPNFSLSDLDVTSKQTLPSVLQRAQSVANDPMHMAWQVHARRREIDILDRNVHELVNNIATSCQALFVISAGAASSTAVISVNPKSSSTSATLPQASLANTHDHFNFRERVVRDDNEKASFAQYLAVRLPADDSVVCFMRVGYARVEHEVQAVSVEELGIILVQFVHPDAADEAKIKALELEFFDDQRAVVVYTVNGQVGTYIGMVTYRDLGYRRQQCQQGGTTREQVVHGLIEQWKNGDTDVERMSIRRSRVLAGCEDGVGSVAVNGRAGRTVACILDRRGMSLETLDMEGDEDAMEPTEGESGLDAEVEEAERVD